jgi:photosystem II stability/assembly factor-like uncharacterized protein
MGNKLSYESSNIIEERKGRKMKIKRFEVIAITAIIALGMAACASVSIVSVDWDSLKGPAKVRQYLSVSTSEVSVYANYKDESRKEVTFFSTSHDRDKTGIQTVTVTVMGQGSGTFQTEVMEMTGIRVENPPTKTTYTVGEKADLAGIKVMGSWIDFPDAEIPTYQVSVSRFDSSSAGNNRLVTVDFKGKTATFPVTVTTAAAPAPAAAAAPAPAASAPAATAPATTAPATTAPTASRSSSWVATTAHPFPTTGYNAIQCIAYANNKWIAGGYGGKMASSVDNGVTWTEISYPITRGTGEIMSIVYANNRWVAGGSGGMATSTDNGVTWTEITGHPFTGINNAILGVAYGNNRWVAVGSEGRIAYSDNGTAWNAVANSTFPTAGNSLESRIWSVAYGNNRWVVVGNYGRMATSVDNGVTWTSIDSPFASDWIKSVVYTNNRWVAISYNNKIATSTNGTTWTLAATFGPPLIYRLESVTYGNNRWIAIGRGIAISTNGTTWIPVESPFNTDFYGIAWGNNKFIAVGHYGAIVSSPTGE